MTAPTVYEIDEGQYAGTGIGNSAANMMWLRTDLMEQAGIDRRPSTWDELREALAAMQGGGIYGAPLPYGRNSMTSLIFIGFIHQAGGHVSSPLTCRSPSTAEGTRAALDFYRECAIFARRARRTIPGATA